jgi:benzoate membrane transport protein
MSRTTPGARWTGGGEPVLAGLVTAIVGFTGAFSVVLAGLRAAGADQAQAASGLLALTVVMGLVGIGLSLRERMPVGVAWSTPGAALLISAGVPPGGWPAAIGAFALAGVLIVAAGLWRPLGDLVAAIPAPLASAMLAGVLLPICFAPARSLVALPWLTAPVVLTWAVLTRFARRWAVPAAILVAAIAVAVDRGGVPGSLSAPHLTWTTPTLTAGAVVGIAVPLFLVTMASQNLTGMAVLGSFGYRPDLRPVLISTGAATVATAPFGGHAINLAAITAALAAGPEAGADRDRRWIATVTAGATYCVIGIGAGLVTAFVAASPALLVEAVAGIALLSALGGALQAAVASPPHRDAAVVTLVVSASGVSALGISAPFWGLVAGLALFALTRSSPAPHLPAGTSAGSPPPGR